MGKKPTYEELEKRVNELEKQLVSKNDGFCVGHGDSVIVPPIYKPIFDEAQKIVGSYFRGIESNPSKGTIEIGGDRYLLIRASALSINFFEAIANLYVDQGQKESQKIGNDVLFDIAHIIGINDARNFHKKMGLKDPIAKLSAGPVHFSHTGWALVDILPESTPSPDEDYLLIYHHPFSFEADAWIRAGKKTDSPVCIMNAGYSSGWCEESFGINLTAVEIACKAKGDDNCTFIMAPPDRIEEHLERYLAEMPAYVKDKVTYQIPVFFEKRKAEETLKANEAFLRHSLESTADGILVIDSNGKVKHANRQFAAMWRIPQELVETHDDKKLLAFVSDQLKEPQTFLSKVQRLYQSTERSFDSLRFKDGRIFERYSRPLVIDEELAGRVWSFRDVTDRKQAEKAQRESEERLAEINECLLSLGVDFDANIDQLTALCGKLLGATCALYNRLEGGMLCSLGQWHTPPDYEPKDRPDGHICYDVIQQGGDDTFVVRNLPETVYARTDPNVTKYGLKTYVGQAVRCGTEIVGSLCAVFQTDTEPAEDDRRFLGILASALGAEENRKQAEEALLKSERRHRTILFTAMDGFLMTDVQGNIREANEAYCRMSGYREQELLAMNISDLEVAMTPDDVATQIQTIIAHGEDRFETRHRCKDGSIFEVEVSVQYTPTEGELMVAFLRDITERKRAEEALLKSEEKVTRSKKMESLGLLAGGVAHDLNNVLSGIVSYPELILMDLPEDSRFRKPIETIQESGHRAVAIVQDLLTVARGVATTKEPLNLNDLVSDYLNSPEFEKLEFFYPTVTVKASLDTDLFNIVGSHVHIRKVVMNLVSNASEAIEGSGNVTISTMNRYIDIPLRGYDDVNVGEYAVLGVSDSGSGIPSDDLKRIFEPFYTKKIMGRSGTGLGLAVVWNVAQDHKGYIDVKSDAKGTTFEVYFPITREEISDKELSIPIKDYKGNGETILVIDDVESQREISCRMLDTLGYKTKAVSSGEEAVEYLKENSVDLLLLDMIMDPGINGRETYERVIKIHSKQKAVIVSGFAETDDVKEAQKSGAGKYIKKPFTIEKIGLAVKQELERL